MFRKYFIISYRKIKEHTLWYAIAVALQTVGLLGLFNAFFLYRLQDHMSYTLIISALLIFLFSQTGLYSVRSLRTEFSIRKLLGAKMKDIYLLLAIDSLMVSIASALISLIILDSSTTVHLVPYDLQAHFYDLSSILFIIGSIVFAGLVSGVLPALRFANTDSLLR